MSPAWALRTSAHGPFSSGTGGSAGAGRWFGVAVGPGGVAARRSPDGPGTSCRGGPATCAASAPVYRAAPRPAVGSTAADGSARVGRSTFGFAGPLGGVAGAAVGGAPVGAPGAGRGGGGGGGRGPGGSAGSRSGAAGGRDRGGPVHAGGGGVAAEQPGGAHRAGHDSRSTPGAGGAGDRGTVRGVLTTVGMPLPRVSLTPDPSGRALSRL